MNWVLVIILLVSLRILFWVFDQTLGSLARTEPVEEETEVMRWVERWPDVHVLPIGEEHSTVDRGEWCHCGVSLEPGTGDGFVVAHQSNVAL